MEENNNPRKTRSGKLLGGVIPGEQAEGQEEVVVEMLAVERIFRQETVVDVIDLTEDYFDVDDDGGAGDMGDIIEDTGNGTITIVDDEASTDDVDDVPTGDNELNEDRNQGVVPDLTIDLTDSPVIRSNPTVFIPSLPSTSGASMPSTSTTTSASSSGNSLPSTAPSNASVAVTCRICLDSQLDLEKEGLNLLSTVCGHIFCSKCFPNYIKKRGLCPICRKVLRPKDFHQIFL